jgi:CubicO group peptidase (beta-lactamase class C family)
MNSFKILICLLLISSAAFAQKKTPPAVYYPEPNQWLTKTPQEALMNAAKLETAIAFAKEKESTTSKNLETAHYQTFGREPFGDAVGPFAERGSAAGIILRHGYIVAEWGDARRVDMTFSVTKSFLSTVVGLAFDRGLIPSIHDTVYRSMAPINVFSNNIKGNKADDLGKPGLINLFDTKHNKTITWDDLLRQTSDWEGTLWGKPDWADRPSNNPAEWTTRPRNKPGSSYEYNDVRVNVLALAALNIWRRPLPGVLKEYIMDPIGASPTWRWIGYENSWVIIDDNLSRLLVVAGIGEEECLSTQGIWPDLAISP